MKMDVDEYVDQKLKQGTERFKLLWAGVKNRFSSQLLEGDDQIQVIDIQVISDECIDLILLRKSRTIDMDQLDHCRITAENRWFKKPKIRMDFSKGPFSKEFFNDK
mgnify:CR=1 FL=1